MTISVSKIIPSTEGQTTPKNEVTIHIVDNSVSNYRRSANITIYLDDKNYTLAEIEAEAIKKAKEFLAEVAQ